jgi:hypothetical protein
MTRSVGHKRAWREIKVAHKFTVGILIRRDHSEVQGVDRRIILNEVLGK